MESVHKIACLLTKISLISEVHCMLLDTKSDFDIPLPFNLGTQFFNLFFKIIYLPLIWEFRCKPLWFTQSPLA